MAVSCRSDLIGGSFDRSSELSGRKNISHEDKYFEMGKKFAAGTWCIPPIFQSSTNVTALCNYVSS